MHATDQQLASAIRQGVSDEGRPLIVMPSEVFQHLSDQEVAAIIALLRKLPRSGTDTPPNVYGPIGRLGLAMGRFKTAPQLVAEYSVQEPIPAGAEFEPGRQLAISRCSGCHGADLSGKEARPGEISPDLLIAGAYDPLAFTKLLRAGVSAGGQKLPMMGPTARSDLSHLTDSEIAQLHGYLVARAHKISH
jgi:cytochrome c553